jgi:hypothetical protein
MDIIAHHRLHFDSSTRTGNVFHLMGALSEFGKLGLTSIGNSLQQAEDLYNQVKNVLDEETNLNSNSASKSSYPSPPIAWGGYSPRLKTEQLDATGRNRSISDD